MEIHGRFRDIRNGNFRRYGEIQGDLSWENPGRHRRNNERWRMEDPMVIQGETWIWNGKSGRDIGRFVGDTRKSGGNLEMFVVNSREGIKNRRSKRDVRRFMKDTGRSDKGDRWRCRMGD
jgi:hypothetical protein